MQVPSIDPNANDAINMQQLLGWMLATIIYNLFFHSLLHRASIIPWSIQILRGTQMFETQKMHDRYGPVVRLSPNHVAFTDPRAWEGIYSTLVGHKSSMTELPKSRAFVQALDDTVTQIINPGPEEHTKTRRALASKPRLTPLTPTQTASPPPPSANKNTSSPATPPTSSPSSPKPPTPAPPPSTPNAGTTTSPSTSRATSSSARPLAASQAPPTARGSPSSCAPCNSARP